MEQLVTKLSKAELITHLVEIDQEAAAEADAAACVLEVLDTQVFRIQPFIYGVNLSELDGATDTDRVDAVSDALSARLGNGAVGLTTLILDPPAEDAETPDMEEDVLLLMRAVATAADKAASENGSDMRAILSAEFAVRAAELTARGLTDLALPQPPPGPDLSPAIEATATALGAFEERLDKLEERVGEVLTSNEASLRTWAETSLVKALEQAENRMASRLEALEGGQFPAEWFMGQIMSRIGELDDQISGNDQQAQAAAHAWSQRLDSRIAAVADQLIPPEWFLGRILSRIGELDEQLSGNDEQVQAAARDWAERLEQRLVSIGDQMPAPEWFLGQITSRIDELEAGLTAAIPDADMFEARATEMPRLLNELVDEQKNLRKSLSILKGQVTTLAKGQTKHAAETAESLNLIKQALAELLARQ